jgi:hypothetical protein
MKYLRKALYLGILLLTLLATGCQMGTAAPPPPSPPPPPPTLPVSATPLIKNNNPGPGAGIANNQNPGSIIPPVCAPPVLTDSVVSFCDNQAAQLGGATFIYGPDTVNILDRALLPKGADCSYYDKSDNKIVCTGAQDTKISVLVCNSCGGYIDAGFPKDDITCIEGYVEQPFTSGWWCIPSPAESTLFYNICPTGTHFDNTLQNCADNTTNQLVSPCPPTYPYYYPANVGGTCFKKKFPGQSTNCQYVTVPLGACLTSVKKVPGTGGQCPAGKSLKCSMGSNGAQSCSCQ